MKRAFFHAKELPGIFDEQNFIRIVEACLTFYKEKSSHGKRFVEILTDADLNDLLRFSQINRFPQKIPARED